MTTVEIQGMKVSVSVYEPYDMDVWYMVLGNDTEVKSFGDETSMTEALESFRQHGYKGCPTDKAHYLKHKEKTMNVTAAIYSAAIKFWVDIELQYMLSVERDF